MKSKTVLSVLPFLVLVSVLFGSLLSGFGVAGASDDLPFTRDSDNAYLIQNEKELNQLASLVRAGDSMVNKAFRLTADLDMTAGFFVSIGNSEIPFSGIFDGNHHTVVLKSVGETMESDGCGLFGRVNGGAVIKNLNVRNTVAYTEPIEGGIFLGGLAYEISDATLQNVTVDVRFHCSLAGGTLPYCSGFGYLNGTTRFENCVARGEMDLTAGSAAIHVGGFASESATGSTQVFVNCANETCIRVLYSGTKSLRLGGFIGRNYGTTTFTGCGNTGDIFADARNAVEQRITLYAGGLIGFQTGTGGDVTIENCFNFGRLEILNGYPSGGAVGTMIGQYQNSTGLSISGTVGPQEFTVGNKNVIYDNSVTGSNGNLSLETLIGAAVRLDQNGLSNSGIRFDSHVNDGVFQVLSDLGFSVAEFGTVIAPSANFRYFGGDTAELIEQGDDGTGKTSGSFVRVVYDQAMTDLDGANFTGALKTIKSENYTLEFSGIGYVCIGVGTNTVTCYAEFTEAGARSVRNVAYAAYYDRSLEKNGLTEYGRRATNFIAEDQNYSPYTLTELNILAIYAGLVR